MDENESFQYESKPAEVEAVLWAAIQKNYMLGKMEKAMARAPHKPPDGAHDSPPLSDSQLAVSGGG